MSTASQSEVPDSVKDAVWLRVGRNLLLFQHIEELIRAILSVSQIEGSLSEFQQLSVRRADEVRRKSLGQLKEQYFAEVMGEGLPAREAPQPLKEVWVRTSFRLEPPQDILDRDKAMFDALVVERNDLAHHFLTRWRAEFAENYQAALDYLDQQRERALPLREHLKSILKALMEHYQETAAFLNSDEGARMLTLGWLQQSRVVTLLVGFSQTRCRPDGWTPLTDAGRWLREVAGDDMDSMKERYGHKQLRRLMEAAELFEIAEEPTDKGVRVVYRVNQQLEEE